MAKKALDDLSFSKVEFLALATHPKAQTEQHDVNFAKNGTHFTVTFSESPTASGDLNTVMGLDKSFQPPEGHAYFFTSGIPNNSMLCDVTIAGEGTSTDLVF